MTFDAREATRAAEATYKPWPFIGLDGETYYLPHPLMIPPGLVKRAQAGEISNEELVEAIAGTETAAALDAMPGGVQAELIRAWRADKNDELAQLGKELTPSSATTDTGVPSRPISPSEGSTSTSGPRGSSAGARKRSSPTPPPSSPEP